MNHEQVFRNALLCALLAFALLAVSLFLAASNWFFLVNGIILFCLFRIRTAKEEENLVARFGDSYKAYMESTGRFFPVFN